MKIKPIESKNELPFIIHVCGARPFFPTHTHGLVEIGWPEFLMDHLAFGPYGNGNRIKCAYNYFSRAENIGKLNSILHGDTLKLSWKELGTNEHPNDLHTYCFREVSPSFEAVNQAYCVKEMGLELPGMRFVQIWVEGDDFALRDEYYRGNEVLM